MKFILFLLLLILNSCALNKTFNFYYMVDGNFKQATGTTAIPAPIGMPLKIRVNKVFKKCQLFVITGNQHKQIDCYGNKNKFIDIDLGVVNSRTLPSIGLTRVLNGEENQTAMVYLGLKNHQYEKVPISYECPLQSQNSNQYTCIRPSKFNFIFTMDFGNHIGKAQIYSADCAGKEIKEAFDASGIMDFRITNDKEGFCHVRVDFKNDEIKLSSSLYINFYSETENGN